MKNIKVIKRKINVEKQLEQTALVQEQTINPPEQKRDITTVITGWINDWRGRKKTDARTAFNDLFEISSV